MFWPKNFANVNVPKTYLITINPIRLMPVTGQVEY